MTVELKKTFGHAGIYALGVILNRAVSFIMLPIYTRFLTPADYGVLEILELTVDIVSIVTGLGILQGLFKYYYQVDSDRDRNSLVSTIFILIIGFYAASCALGVAFSNVISALVFDSASYAYFVKLSFVNLFLSFLIYVPLAYIRTRQLPVLFVAISSVQLAMQLSLNILFVVYLEMGIAGVLYSTLISSVAIGGALTLYTFHQTGVLFSRPFAAKLIRFGYPFVISGFGAFILTYADRYFLNYYQQLSDVGIYALGYKFGFLLMMFPIRPIFNIWMVQRFEIVKQSNYTAVFNHFLLWFMIVSVSAVLFISLFSRDVIRIMADSAYWDAYKVVPIIVTAYLFQACTDFFNFGIYHSGRTQHIAYGTGISAVLIMGLSFVFIPWYGIYGAAWATFICFFIRMIYVYLASQRLFRIDYALQKPAMVLLTAGAVYLLQTGILHWFPELSRITFSLAVDTVLFLLWIVLLPVLNLIGKEDRKRLLEMAANPRRTLSFAGKSST